MLQASVEKGVEIRKADGSPLSPYDLKRLQVNTRSLSIFLCIISLVQN